MRIGLILGVPLISHTTQYQMLYPTNEKRLKTKYLSQTVNLHNIIKIYACAEQNSM